MLLKVVAMSKLSPESVHAILKKAAVHKGLQITRGTGGDFGNRAKEEGDQHKTVEEEALTYLSNISDGDARFSTLII